MTKIINNIGHLLKDLHDNGWHMTAFFFPYNNYEYDVLFENNDNLETRTNRYASVVLNFIDVHEPTRQYSVEANQVKMFFDPREFREFFHIQYVKNLGNVFQQFFNSLLRHVPESVPDTLNERQNLAIDHLLAGRGTHNPEAVYCYDARRLGRRNEKQMHRSIFISNLTERRKPELYGHFKNDDTITFFYSPNEHDELSDIEIIDKFTKREDARRAKKL